MHSLLYFPDSFQVQANTLKSFPEVRKTGSYLEPLMNTLLNPLTFKANAEAIVKELFCVESLFLFKKVVENANLKFIGKKSIKNK